MQIIRILDYLLQELRAIKSEHKEYRNGYIQAIKDMLTAYEDYE